MTASYDSNLLSLNLAELSKAIQSKSVSPVEVTRQTLDRIQAVDPKVNAYITVMAEEASDEAKQAEKDLLAGNSRGPLHGIPIALKDLIYTKSCRTTMGSEIFKDFVPDYDAAVVEKLRAAGAIIIGKLNTHQFAYGPIGDRSYFGPTRNPYNLAKITGGSSSGAGAAVASLMCYGAIGTDTGGSIRIPSSCCGLVGMKPTFGLVSKYGAFPLGYTLDHVGPLTRTVQDNALLLNAIAGYDARDPYSVEHDPVDYTRSLRDGIQGMVIGLPSSYYFEKLDGQVEKGIQAAIDVLQDLGAEICTVNLPSIQSIVKAQQVVARGEAYAIHEKLLTEHFDEYEEEVRERLLTGVDVKAYEYVQAAQVKWTAINEYNEALKQADVLLTPTLPILPTEINQREVMVRGSMESVRAALLRFTAPTNLNGFPSLAVPCGFSDQGLPIGFQLIGRAFDEATLYRVAYSFEQANELPDVKMEV